MLQGATDLALTTIGRTSRVKTCLIRETERVCQQQGTGHFIVSMKGKWERLLTPLIFTTYQRAETGSDVGGHSLLVLEQWTLVIQRERGESNRQVQALDIHWSYTDRFKLWTSAVVDDTVNSCFGYAESFFYHYFAGCFVLSYYLNCVICPEVTLWDWQDVKINKN